MPRTATESVADNSPTKFTIFFIILYEDYLFRVTRVSVNMELGHL
jgi:hypothetical protein